MGTRFHDAVSVIDIHETRRVRTAKFTAVIVFLISALWVAIGIWVQVPTVSYAAGMLLITSVMTFILASTGRDWLARVLWMISGTLALVIGHFIVHPVANVQVMLLAMTGGPFLLFSLKSERKTMISLVVFNVASLFFMILVPHDTFGPPLIGYETALTYFRWPAMFSVLAVLIIEMLIFAYTTEQYNRKLLEANRDAQESNRAKSAFLASMSHEIRTPMNGVVGLIEMLEGSDLNNDQRRMLRTIRESSFSLLRIIDDILDTSKIEAGRLELRPAPMHLLSVVEGAVETMRSFADARDVQLRLQYDSDLPVWITADPGRLRQILLNLLSNAVKFSSKNPQQTGLVDLIVTLDKSGRLEMYVKDNGIGMSDEMLKQVFQPFSQAEEVSKRHFGGTGLGLTIVKQLLEKMGGYVLVDSAPNCGATFTVNLPIVAGNGTLEFPNLEGYTVYMIDDGLSSNRMFHRYVQRLNVNFVMCSSMQTLINEARRRREKTIVIVEDVVSSQASQVKRQLEALVRAKINVPTLLISNDRSRSFGAQGHMYAVQSRPLLLSDLLTAMAYLSDAPMEDVNDTARPSVPTLDVTLGREMRLLVAEDNEINQFVIQKQLEKLECQATIVSDGEEALEQWRTGQYDIVLTDCHMPNMNGFELTESVRESERANKGKRTPIIAITANALSGEADRCLAAGMDDFLSKPVQIEQLAKVLSKWKAQAGK